VRLDEPTCPFCGARTVSRRRTRAGPWAAAVVAAGLSTVSLACMCYGVPCTDGACVPSQDAMATDAAPGTDADATDAAPGTDAAVATDGAPAADAAPSDAGIGADL